METNPDTLPDDGPEITPEEEVPATPSTYCGPPSGLHQSVEYQSGEVPLCGNEPLP